MGTAFFVEGGKNFVMCTWVKNGYRGGDVFGCCSLGKGGVKEGEENFAYKKELLGVKQKTIFSIIC